MRNQHIFNLHNRWHYRNTYRSWREGRLPNVPSRIVVRLLWWRYLVDQKTGKQYIQQSWQCRACCSREACNSPQSFYNAMYSTTHKITYRPYFIIILTEIWETGRCGTYLQESLRCCYFEDACRQTKFENKSSEMLWICVYGGLEEYTVIVIFINAFYSKTAVHCTVLLLLVT